MLDGVVLHSGGDYGSGETFTFTAPTTPATAAPAPAPTAAPEEPPLAPPTDVDLRSHPKLGNAMLLTWHAAPSESAAASSSRFRVQYRIKGEDHWVDDTATDGDDYVPEWDGVIYHILSDEAIACGTKVDARVAATVAGGQSDYAEAPKTRKLKC